MPIERVCLGILAGAHGVRGTLRVKSFTERPEDIAVYGPLFDRSGARSFELEIVGRAKNALLARVAGIEDRESAQALAGTRLYLPRERLPTLEEAETYYHADLIGLAAEDREGRPLGSVVAIANFGAGDMLEVRGEDGTTTFHPFTRAVVPVVDIEGGRLVVDLPGEVETGAGQEESDEA